MKWAAIILGLFIFVWFIVPPLFRAMKKHDYDNLYHGMRDARVAGGAFVEDDRPYHSYAEKYVRGQ